MHLHHIMLDYIKVQWNSMIFSHVTVHAQYVKWANVVQNHHENFFIICRPLIFSMIEKQAQLCIYITLRWII